MAREGYYYWLEWPKYLEVVDKAGMARYVNTGCLVIKTPLNKNLKNVMASLEDLGVRRARYGRYQTKNAGAGSANILPG